MTCKDFLRLLDANADLFGHDMADHLKACSSCRQALYRWQSVSSEMRNMRQDVRIPAHLHSRIMGTVRAAGPPPLKRRSRSAAVLAWWPVRAAAAALLVAFGVFGLSQMWSSGHGEDAAFSAGQAPSTVYGTVIHAGGGGSAASAVAATGKSLPVGTRLVVIPVRVDCSLFKLESGDELILLRIPESVAPPPGTPCTVLVHKNGKISVMNGDGRWLESRGRYFNTTIKSLDLGPGRYQFGRAATS
ncbi:MAG: hypothetical protein P8Z49_02040 [Acidobacteriota bacterium]